MSSGFHQVAPIIVQAGLMKKNEVMCIENPEVHLHPKLQLDIAEFLVRQAIIGKYMIVETHSDLVVRRVMRAVLEEELKQEAVRLYFARMDTTSEQYGQCQVAYSVLEPIEINGAAGLRTGRLASWMTTSESRGADRRDVWQPVRRRWRRERGERRVVKTSCESQDLQEGDVVYFGDLHLETARRVTDTPVHRDIHKYEVHGKARPMLILDAIGEDDDQVKFFRVLKLSTKISKFKRKIGYVNIGQILDDRITYIDRDPHCLPANLIDGDVKKQMDRLFMMDIYRLIGATLRLPSAE